MKKNILRTPLFRTLGVTLVAFTALNVQAEPNEKVGVFFGSYGDVDDPSEVEAFVKKTISDPDVVPLPRGVGGTIAALGWPFIAKGLYEEYKAIGNKTNMRASAQAQAEAVAAKLREAGTDAKAYTGFTMTFPFVEETLAKAQADGVDKLVVFYQGAQYSHVTAYIVFREVKKYLAKHPEWDVKVTGVRSFSGDARFVDLVTESIEQRMNTTYAGIPRKDICVFLPMHGNVMTWINRGDPSYDQMVTAVDKIKERFPESFMNYGFQNHDEIPLTKWTQPKDDDALIELAKQPCENVIINGRISFTVDSLETLYDHAIGEKEFLQQEIQKLGKTKNIVAEKMFNSEPGFVELMKDLTLEALLGQGDLETLK